MARTLAGLLARAASLPVHGPQCACASSACMLGACRAPVGSPAGTAALKLGAKFPIAPSHPLPASTRWPQGAISC